jgi:transposase
MLQLTGDQLDWLCERIPDQPKNSKGGRPSINKRQAIRGIFWILDNGAKWKDLPREFGSKSAVHRWFQHWTRTGIFGSLMAEAGRVIEERDGFKLYECFIDGTFSKAKGGGPGVGCTRVGKGVKIMILVDAKGLPIAVCSETAQCHEGHLVQELFEFMITEAKPQRVIGDKAYDSDRLDQEMANEGVEMIAPHRAGRLPQNQTQDGRPLRRYRRRWTVERTIAWIQNFRRLCIRWEKSTTLFQGFLHLSCSLLLLKEVLG